MPRNERTSKRIATIAGRILQASARIKAREMVYVPYGREFGDGGYAARPLCTLAELRALAASALTQAADKAAKGKKPRQIRSLTAPREALAPGTEGASE